MSATSNKKQIICKTASDIRWCAVASIVSGVLLETADGQLEADSDHCKHWQTAAPLSSRNQQHTTDVIISGEHPGLLAESLDRR